MKFYLLTLLTLLIIGCEDDYDGCKRSQFYDLGDLFECHKINNPDSASLAQALIGRWQKYFVTGPQLVGRGACTESDSLVVEFKSNGTYFVYEQGTLIDSSTWFLKIVYAQPYGIQDSIFQYVGGRIVICEDEAVFDYSYIDLSEKYYRRIE